MPSHHKSRSSGWRQGLVCVDGIFYNNGRRVDGNALGQNRISALIEYPRYWPRDKQQLIVHFRNGKENEKKLVRDIVTEHFHAVPMHIRFTFLEPHELDHSDIRLRFASESWSFIGRAAERHPRDDTMCLNMSPGFDTEKENDTKIQADILHEFGHALGRSHEQQHDQFPYVLNEAKIKARVGEDFYNTNWSRPDDTVSWTHPYDPESIMHYSIRKGDTVNGRTEIPAPNVLSAGDKRWLAKKYPLPQAPTPTLELVPRKKTSKGRKPKTTTWDPDEQVVVAKPDYRNPTTVTGNGHNTVQGGYVVVSGNSSAVINGGGYVEVTGNSDVIVYGDSNVSVSGNGSVFVHGSGHATVSGNGSATFTGQGTGTTSGNGSITSLTY